MDTAISGGDFLKDSRGRPVVIDGIDEILQRVRIRLEVKKGEFLYDKDLGSNLHSLKSDMENLNDKALAYAREAIAPMCEVNIESAEVEVIESGLKIKFKVSKDDEHGEVAVII